MGTDPGHERFSYTSVPCEMAKERSRSMSENFVTPGECAASERRARSAPIT